MNDYLQFRPRKTIEVKVGNISIGGDSVVSIQSMTNIPTRNVPGNVKQICELYNNGCEIVRLAVSSAEDVKSLADIKAILTGKGIDIPVVADVHFSPKLATDCLKVADKVRINAGNFADKLTEVPEHSEEYFLAGKKNLQEKLRRFFSEAKSLNKPVRIGINRGSLAPRILHKFENSYMAMWESARECLEVARAINFDQIVLSFKSSDVQDMIDCNRFAVQQMTKFDICYPIHLGVTESGEGEYGRTKSIVGIGTLLSEGIGNTIRVSLTEDPVNEIVVAKNILQACGQRSFFTEVVSCPSCGRTSYDIQSTVKILKQKLPKMNVKIAVMGCIINGLGEAKNADFTIIGNPNGTLSLYRQHTRIYSNLTISEVCNHLVNLCKN